MCFPGGKQDPDDLGNDIATALRETKEEVGLDPSNIVPLCRLGTLETASGFCVTPIVGHVVHDPPVFDLTSLTLCEQEVEAAFLVPLSLFLEEPTATSWSTTTSRGTLMRTYHYFDPIRQKTFAITGITAYIAHQVAEMAASASPRRPHNRL